MANQDFEQFKAEIKAWLDAHPDEYDRFVAEVNDKSATGLFKIFKLGLRLAPKMMLRYKRECHGDLADEQRIQAYAADNDTAKSLVEEFRHVAKDSIVPAMLAWLYYGKCYETMVLQLEAETTNQANNFMEKKFAGLMVRFVIRSSVRNKMRTKEDWETFYNEKKTIDSGNIVAEGIEGLPANHDGQDETETANPDALRTLKDYLVENPDTLLEKIKMNVATHHTGPDLARLYFALQEEGLLRGCDVASFHRMLSAEMPNCDLKSVRNLQVAVKKLNDDTSRGKIKDLKVERVRIDELKAYLVGKG